VYAWVDAFLLPEPGRESGLHWGTDLKAALDRSREAGLKTGQPKPVFVDFTGVTCTNCKYNEFDVFPLPKVREQLEKFERVQLYTDWVPEELYAADPGHRERVLEARANRLFKIDVFKTDQLPLYAVLLPQVSGGVKVLGVYDEGKINEPDRFAQFLRDALEKARK
jgi:thiol:disulfide interchange protein DsbD